MTQDHAGSGGTWAHPEIPGTLKFPTDPIPLPPKWSAPAADAPLSSIWQRLNPEQISCAGSACQDELHCFRLTKRMAKGIGPGTCRECKQPLVEMSRIAQQNLSDVDYTFSALQLEYVRHYFWHVPFSGKAMSQALRAAQAGLEGVITKRIRQRVAKAEPYFDGRQTPTAATKADALDYAMHAVAACCRVCARYWHGIPQGRPLTEDEVAYLAELMSRYLLARLPGLEEDPPRVLSTAATPVNIHPDKDYRSAPNEDSALSQSHTS